MIHAKNKSYHVHTLLVIHLSILEAIDKRNGHQRHHYYNLNHLLLQYNFIQRVIHIYGKRYE